MLTKSQICLLLDYDFLTAFELERFLEQQIHLVKVLIGFGRVHYGYGHLADAEKHLLTNNKYLTHFLSTARRLHFFGIINLRTFSKTYTM